MRTAAVVSFLCAASAFAQPARLVRDIDPGTRSDGLQLESGPAADGNSILFGARRMGSAFEFWRSDGTPGGTSAFDSIHGGSAYGSSPVTALGPGLFAVVIDSRELWASDGTKAGTRRIRRFEAAGSQLVAAGDAAYFAAADGESDPVLWRTDGSEAGTLALADVTPSYLRASGNRLFFFVTDDAGQSLWTSDGTAEGTAPRSSLASEREVVEEAAAGIDGRFYFFTRSMDDPTRFRLWTSEGAENDLHSLAFFAGDYGACPMSCPPYGPSDLTPFEDGMIFIANDGVHARQIWRTDGTTSGTRLIRSVAPGGLAWGLEPAGDLVFFGADDGVHGYELWRTDGTAAGTKMVIDLVPGDGNATECCGLTSGAFRGRVVFGANGGELWWSDGTEAGTSKIATISDSAYLYPLGFIETPEALFFYVANSTYGFELWRTDGTKAGTMRLDRGVAAAGSNPYFLLDAQGRLFFSPLEEGGLRSLWTSDGTAVGTRALHTFEELGPASFVTTSSSLPIGGRLYFTANDGVHGYELWVSDGVSDTHLVKDIVPGFPGTASSFLGSVGERAIFAAYTDLYGLWVTDGTEGGTHSIGAASVVVESSGGTFGGRVFFAGFDDAHGGELWVTDGTDDGTRLVKDIHPGPGDSYVWSFIETGGRLSFFAFDGTSHGLWSTDGTPEGTLRAASFPDSGYSLSEAGGLLYFMLQNALWRSDGTEAGTLPLRSIYASGIVSSGGLAYFAADDGEHGSELWRSDGTPQGTIRVTDLQPGEVSGVFGPLTVAGGLLAFAGDDGVHGVELWVSDGTAAGTGMVQDIARGPGSSFPARLVVSGTELFFVADDGFTGAELWAISIASLVPHTPRALGPGAQPDRSPRELPARP